MKASLSAAQADSEFTDRHLINNIETVASVLKLQSKTRIATALDFFLKEWCHDTGAGSRTAAVRCRCCVTGVFKGPGSTAALGNYLK